MKERRNEDIASSVLTASVFFTVGMIIGLCIQSLMVDIELSQETADDICVQLTNNSAAVALNLYNSEWRNKLVCDIPSFDKTQNIIIRSNSDGE